MQAKQTPGKGTRELERVERGTKQRSIASFAVCVPFFYAGSHNY
jgi:hypothetical protein